MGLVLTLTFRDCAKSFRAHRLFGYFVRDLGKDAGIPIFWFRADEIGSQGGRFHIHALIARILPFDAKRGAGYCCAKYLTKQFGDWKMRDNVHDFTENQPLLSLDGMSKPPAPFFNLSEWCFNRTNSCNSYSCSQSFSIWVPQFGCPDPERALSGQRLVADKASRQLHRSCTELRFEMYVVGQDPYSYLSASIAFN